MKIKVPREIKLLTHKYKVRSNSKELLGLVAMAVSRHFLQDIILDTRNIPPSELNQTFLHEIVHIIERHFSMRFDDGDTDRLAEGFAAILFDNFGIELDWSDIQEE